ncbi:MAG: FIST N-terminal domain-containing protein [Sulfurimonadaceae bacterium]
MKTETITLFHNQSLQPSQLLNFKNESNLLVQVFSSLHKDLDTLQSILDALTTELPQAVVIGATTDGEIEAGNVYTNSTVISFTCFEDTQLSVFSVKNSHAKHYADTLVETLVTERTKLLLIFTDGTTTNGEAFLSAIHDASPATPIAGGMAGDGASFTQTYIIHGKDIIDKGAVAVALDSDRLHVKTDYSFDWQPLGRAMVVTKAKDNRVYEIDHQPVTTIYGKYLGQEIEDALPNIGIEFPLLLKRNDLIFARAVVAKFDDGSLVFAGNLDEGDRVYLGFADINQVIHNSLERAEAFSNQNIETFFIYSCMARRRFMRDIIHTEIEPYAQMSSTAGFFTYGEFFHANSENYLFNESMTIVALSENIDKPIEHKPISRLSFDSDENRTFKALSHLFKVTQTEYEFNQQLLNTVVKTGRIGYFIREHEHDTIDFSDIAKEIFGLELFDHKAYRSGFRSLMTLLRHLIHPDDQTKALTVMQEATDRREGYELDCRIVLPNGLCRHIKLITHLSFTTENRLYRTVGTIYDLSELKEEQLRHEELSFLVENAINEVYIVDAKTLIYQYANTKALDVLGYTHEELKKMNVYDINPELSTEDVAQMMTVIGHQEMITNESVHQSRDGSRYPTRSQIYHTRYFGKDVYVIFSTDITQEKHQKMNELTLKKTLENVLDYSGTLFLLSSGTEIVHANKALLHFLGLNSVEELKGRYHCMMDIFEEEENYFSSKKLNAECQGCECIATLVKGDILGVIKHAPSGQKRVMKLNLNQLPNDNYIISMTDVTEIEEEAKRFQYQANHDKLTGAYNRSYLDFIYQKHLDEFAKSSSVCSFILLDIDDFKQINDNYGHLTGDRVLILLSNLINHKIRHDDVFIRWGGEEFLILLPHTSKENAVTTAETLRQEISKIDIGIDYRVTCSFGVTECQNGDTKETLFERLDKALYKAKNSGKNCVKTL